MPEKLILPVFSNKHNQPVFKTLLSYSIEKTNVAPNRTLSASNSATPEITVI
jgi:hypothetical protein